MLLKILHMTKGLRWPIAVGGLTLLGSLTAAANSEGDDLDYVLQLSLQELLKLETSIASGESSSILKSVSTVTVITREDIERYHFATLADALRTVAGLDVSRTYFKNNIPTARGILQDHYANKVLLMINNVPSWHAVTGEGNLDRINLHDVEKIEVLKGPASVLYGTNAYSGAINVVLKKAESTRNQVYASAGNHDAYSSGGAWGYVDDTGDLSLRVSAHGTHDGRQSVKFTDENGVRGDFDDYLDNSNVTLNGRYKQHSLLINAYDNTEAYMGIVPSYAQGIGYGHELSGYLIGYQLEQPLDDVSRLNMSLRYDWNRREFMRSVKEGSWGETEGYHLAGKAIYSRELAGDYSVDVGVDFDQRESVFYRNYLKAGDVTLTQNNLHNRDILEYSVFTTLGYEKNDWKWNLGLRNVENELFDNSLSARATVVYSLSERSSVKWIAGQSYRSPSLFELYLQSPEQTVFGNPELSPEESTSYEIAYLHSIGKFFMQVSAYRAIYAGKIFRVQDDVVLPNGVTVYDTLIYSNGQSIHLNGLEAELRYRSESWSAFANFNWQDGDDGDRVLRSDHYNFKYVPSYTFSSGVSKDIEDVRLSAIMNYRDSTQGSTSDRIDSSLMMDVAVSRVYPLGEDRSLMHKVALTNVTNERVEVADYARRRGLVAVPEIVGRALNYEVTMSF